MSDAYWQTAAEVCTDKELRALVLRDRFNLGTRQIALNLDISRSSVRERLDNADRKIHAALTAKGDLTIP